MDTSNRKKLIDAYKNRTIIGGVYCIQCSGNNRKWIRSTTDMEGARNRFMFAVKIKSTPEPAMLQEFQEYGIDSFSFDILEELKKEETQTNKEFAEDIKALYEIWLEKYEKEIK